MRTSTVKTPIGEVWLAVSANGVVAVGLGSSAEVESCRKLLRRFPHARFEAARDPEGACSALSAYFDEGKPLEDVRVHITGTPFEQRVLRALRAIPWGTTVSYAELALRVGAPGAARAVGRVNAENLVALVLPCHRVVGKSGALTGYAWGLERKAWLLAHEARYARARVA